MSSNGSTETLQEDVLDLLKPSIRTTVAQLLGFEEETIVSIAEDCLKRNLSRKDIEVQLKDLMAESTQPFLEKLYSDLIPKAKAEKAEKITRDQKNQVPHHQEITVIIDLIEKRIDQEIKKEIGILDMLVLLPLLVKISIAIMIEILIEAILPVAERVIKKEMIKQNEMKKTQEKEIAKGIENERERKKGKEREKKKKPNLLLKFRRHLLLK